MRFPAALIILPLVLAVPVTASRADALPTVHRHARPVSSAEAPVPAPRPVPADVTATPAPAALPPPPAQLAAPDPVVAPGTRPPAQAVGVVGVAPSPDQTR